MLFINVQRFTFTEVTWSGNPYPNYFTRVLHYEDGFDKSGLSQLTKQASKDKDVVLFI